MPDQPVAYFITFTTYGVWLHGRDIGSVDKQHNDVNMPWLAAHADREHRARQNLREPPYLLDTRRRQIVLDTILEVAKHRCWHVLACYVRTTHIHIVVTASC